jgi:hypothetical protein
VADDIPRVEPDDIGAGHGSEGNGASVDPPTAADEGPPDEE